ncbi:MAG: putative sugar nucleotidyl transferase [candidate division Zixibacteria bacterium]|nr:putative sugar nucleotidyl transferase [candidate division Zixibacteria bacterium]
MSKWLIIFEDDRFDCFYPLTYLRPVYFLRPGIRAMYEKIIDDFPGYKSFLFCRPEIAAVTSEMTHIPVNHVDEDKAEEVILINGRLRLSADFAAALNAAGKNAFLTSGGNVAAIKVVGGLTPDEQNDLNNGELGAFADKIRRRSEALDVEIPFYQYLWEMVNAIDEELADDFESLRKQTGERIKELELEVTTGKASSLYPGVHFINPGSIYAARDAELLPGSVIDASKGPIFIGTGARIEPYTYLIGPAYLGKDSILVGGRIAGSSIGPVCRVGGELEETIIQGYSNKYHAGFIGHSYIGEWVNLGAMTTNSDLKNNYSAVRVSVNGKEIDTGSMKVGSFIGDFTKTAIGTLLNTGINIGIVCNIVSDGVVADKEIPSFTWYSSRHKIDYQVAKVIETIKRTMGRRGKELSPQLSALLTEISRLKSEKKE